MNKSDIGRKYSPAALILGGSEGIGRQFAEELAGAGLDLVLVSRTATSLERAAAELRSAYAVKVTTYTQDLAVADLRPFLGQLLEAHDAGMVVCNAGATHGVGAFLDEPLEKALNLVRLNCLTPVTVAHEVLTRRRTRAAALIIVSSMSALCGSGFVATYAAAKAFEIALCEGLHWELAREGMDVLCAVAGLTDTPAMRRSGLSFTAAAAKGFVPMSAAEVAHGALEHLGAMPVWYAVGQATADALRAVPRPELTAAMSEASAALYNISLPSK